MLWFAQQRCRYCFGHHCCCPVESLECRARNSRHCFPYCHCCLAIHRRTVVSVSARSAVSAAARTALTAAIHNAHDGEVDAGGIKQIAAVFGLFVARGWNTAVELPLYACCAKRDGLLKHGRSSCVRALNASSASSGRSLCASIQSRVRQAAARTRRA